MTDQISTPGSNAESSINVGKTGAAKDKSCPFCQQRFTSSSLGRHLDLYIREVNPKHADGIHDADEIRKLRGGITRRQPRNSTSRREGSTPAGTPGVNGDSNGRRTPRPEPGRRLSAGPEITTPTVRRQPTDLNTVEGGKGPFHTMWHKASWQATGVINDIPPIQHNNDHDLERSEGEGDDRNVDRRTVDGRRTASRQVLAKTAFEQKQKMQDAIDNARAAELALREVLGSIRAANRCTKPTASPFDYDPISHDFPALTLRCLPPPPTLEQASPMASRSSWSISPPDKVQYEALCAHFREEFHAWRVNIAVSSSAHLDDFLPYSSDLPPSLENEAAEINAAVHELEEKILSHLNDTFKHWSSLTPANREQSWRLQVAVAVGRKDNVISSLKSDREKILQENANLRGQVEQLSRCQQPKEFQKMPPTTVPISGSAAVEIGKKVLQGGEIGLSLSDRNEPLAEAVRNSIGRWLQVVRSSRPNMGMADQRSLDQSTGDNLQPQSISQIQDGLRSTNTREFDKTNNTEMDIDADGDADPDAEPDKDGSHDVRDLEPLVNQGRAPEAQMGMISPLLGNNNGPNGTTNATRDRINRKFPGGRAMH